MDRSRVLAVVHFCFIEKELSDASGRGVN